MNGTITKYRKKDGRISWGYWFRHPLTKEQITRSGFDTRSAAVDARDEALDAAHRVSGRPVTSQPASSAAEPTQENDRARA